MFRGYEMYCHEPEVMGLNSGWVKLGVLVLLSKLSVNNKITWRSIDDTT